VRIPAHASFALQENQLRSAAAVGTAQQYRRRALPP
jgi:hypothetical protein